MGPHVLQQLVVGPAFVGKESVVAGDLEPGASARAHLLEGSLEPRTDGVLVMEAPDLWFVRDTNKDGKADWMERELMGMSSADSHHTANSMCLDPGGAVYLSDGVFHRTQVETATGPVRNNDAAIYRFEPRTGKFETSHFFSTGFQSLV